MALDSGIPAGIQSLGNSWGYLRIRPLFSDKQNIEM